MKFFKFRGSVLGCLIFISSGACTTEVRTQKPENLKTDTAIGSGFAFIYDFKVEDEVVGGDGCFVELKNAADKSHIKFDIHYGNSSLIADVKPGTYYFHNLTCGRWNWDLLDKVPPIEVIDGKISLVSPMVFKISDQKRIHFNYWNRPESLKRISKFWGLLNNDTKARLISGYTKVPVTEDFVAETQAWGLTEVSMDGHYFKSVPRSRFRHFKPCYNKESEKNTLWLGHLEVFIDYKPELKTEFPVQANSFSQDFVKCVMEKAMSFDNSKWQYQRVHLIF